MPIKYGRTPQPEPEIPPEPEIQNEEIVVEPSPPPPPQETPQYESPEVEEVEKTEETENGWELGEEDARNIAMVIISMASFFPYWPAKKRELEEKYGSIEEFRAQYEENLRKALGHPWVQKVVRNISWLQHLTLIPFLVQTFELFAPPSKQEEKIENVEIPPPQPTQSPPETIYTPSKQQIVEGAFTIHD